MSHQPTHSPGPGQGLVEENSTGARMAWGSTVLCRDTSRLMYNMHVQPGQGWEERDGTHSFPVSSTTA